MTYCLGIAVDQGLVLASDLRTNAGVDYVTSFSKPALDRIVRANMSLEDAARLCLVSLDATSRSNVTVGPPFELVVYPRDGLALSHRLKLAQDSALLNAVSRSWNQGLRQAFDNLPRFDWEAPPA
jgi:putative proteasome-type protease